ncbi:MAG TPA: hypothetical protein DD979_18210 [Gammaproteobacteria bacterium]|jgi:uncharacterized membrane protein AbrB (regulator of aidB expression)|nr:hypothetical protein [Gammaproteobacteria bacterium]
MIYAPTGPLARQAPRPAQTPLFDHSRRLLAAAKTGALLGAAGAAATTLHQLQKQQASWQDVARNSTRAALQTGIATAAASDVAYRVRQQPGLSLAATLLTATAVLYALKKPQTETDHA